MVVPRACDRRIEMRINVGCGRTPTAGWQNFDNSPSLALSKIPSLAKMLWQMGALRRAQYEFIQFARVNRITYGDAVKGLPLKSASVGVFYSSHLFHLLTRNQVARFLNEALRVLRPGGIIRIAVPDIHKLVDTYYESGDADALVAGMRLCTPRPQSLSQYLPAPLRRVRSYQWMYDGASLSALLRTHGFVNAFEAPRGHSRIQAPGELDLCERASESVYVEADKPH
jgi:predicted SAM-dependent methyltransferase